MCTARHRSGECYIATDGSDCERTVSASKDKLKSQYVGDAEAVQWLIGYIARIRDRQGPIRYIAGIRERPRATGSVVHDDPMRLSRGASGQQLVHGEGLAANLCGGMKLTGKFSCGRDANSRSAGLINVLFVAELEEN